MSIFRAIVVCFLSLLIGTFAAGGFFYYQLMQPVLKERMVLEIKAGDHKVDFANQLRQVCILPYPWFYAVYMQVQAPTIKRGEYLFQPGASLYSMWQQVSKGTGFYYRSFTIVPGWTTQQLRQALLATQALHREAAYQPDAVWSRVLNMRTPPEGLLLPETYFYTKGTADWVIF